MRFFVREEPDYPCLEPTLEAGQSTALFQSYLSISARVCSPPAIDRRFKIIDFLVIFDIQELDEPSGRRFPVGVMKYLRATFRLIALVGITAGYYLLWLVGRPFLTASQKGAVDWHGRNFQGWARSAARIINLKINVRNAPPAAPFLLVSNHLSYVDIVVIESQVDCAFIAKSEIAHWPILGRICSNLGTIFIDRTQKRDIMRTLAKVESAMKQGFGVVLFAEGTSTAGHSVAPFRPSLLELAARRQMPVHYASLTYFVPEPGASAEQSVCWWGDMTFGDHVFRLLQLPGFEAEVVFGPNPVLAADRRALAQELWSAVNDVFTPVTSER